MTKGAVILVAALAVGVAACMDTERDHPSVIPDDQMSIGAGNQTDRVLELLVDGRSYGVVEPRSERMLEAAELPMLPWHAELRLPSGRTIVDVTIQSGSVRRTETSASGVAARVDLSCGRVEIWSGPPLSGPAPGPGDPGDCD